LAGATNTPELAMAANLEVHVDLTTISAMTWSRSAGLLVFAGAIGGDITTNGIALSPVYFNKTTGNAVTLQDSFSLDTGYDLYFIGGNLDINSQTVVVPGQIIISGAGVRTLTLGSSDITFAQWSYTGSNLTVAANTANMTQTGVSFAGSNTGYHDITFTAANPRITGSNTFNVIDMDASAAVKTVTFVDGTTQTVNNITRDAGTNVITLTGTGAAGWNIVKAGGGTIFLDYVAVSYSAATPTGTWIAGNNSTDTVGNTGWLFGGLLAGTVIEVQAYSEKKTLSELRHNELVGQWRYK